jgi:hypothetical protein
MSQDPQKIGRTNSGQPDIGPFKERFECDEVPDRPNQAPNVVLHYEACICGGTGKIGGHRCKTYNTLVLDQALWEKLGKPKTADAASMPRVA